MSAIEDPAVNVEALFSEFFAPRHVPIQTDWPYGLASAPPPRLSHRERLGVALEAAEWVNRRGYGGEDLEARIVELRSSLEDECERRGRALVDDHGRGDDASDNDAGEGRG